MNNQNTQYAECPHTALNTQNLRLSDSKTHKLCTTYRVHQTATLLLLLLLLLLLKTLCKQSFILIYTRRIAAPRPRLPSAPRTTAHLSQ